MKFTIAIEPATRKMASGVVVPDLPGCFSAGDAVEAAFHNARKAIEAHCELLAEVGRIASDVALISRNPRRDDGAAIGLHRALGFHTHAVEVIDNDPIA